MRVVGILLVLAASAAFQLPWIACHGDCRHGPVLLWNLGEHAEHEHDGHGHGHDGCGHDGHGEPSSTTAEEDHAPGDHLLRTHLSLRPLVRSTASPDSGVRPLALQASPTIPTPMLRGYVEARAETFDTGPPARLASTRLLL